MDQQGYDYIFVSSDYRVNIKPKIYISALYGFTIHKFKFIYEFW